MRVDRLEGNWSDAGAVAGKTAVYGSRFTAYGSRRKFESDPISFFAEIAAAKKFDSRHIMQPQV